MKHATHEIYLPSTFKYIHEQFCSDCHCKCSSVRILPLFTNHLELLRLLTLRRQDSFSRLWNGSNKIEISPPVPPQDSRRMDTDCRPPFWELIVLLGLEESEKLQDTTGYEGVLSPHVCCRDHDFLGWEVSNE